MGRPRTVSNDAILQAARDVFIEQGSSASTSTIAERVGLSQAALFKRFGTKNDLMMAALAPPEVPPFVPLLEAGPSGEQPVRDELVAIAAVAARFFRDMVPCLMVLRTSEMTPDKMFEHFDVPPPIRAQAALAGYFTRAMDAGLMRRADPIGLTFSFLGAFYMRAFLTHLIRQPLSDEDLDAYAESIVDTLWRGLAPEPS